MKDTVILPRELTDEMAEAIAFEALCCGGMAYSAYEALIAAAPVDAAWTSIEDGLPESDKEFLKVIVFETLNQRVTHDYFVEPHKMFDYFDDYVTHWMYLPDAPSLPKL